MARRAAMYAALGRQTKLSRTGQSIVFCTPQRGRSDLSDNEAIAADQLADAGIPPATDEQVVEYERWQAQTDQRVRVARARFLITRTFYDDGGRESVALNRVALIDGRNCEVATATVPAIRYHDPDALNQIGQRGAYGYRPDHGLIASHIEAWRRDHPDYAGAPVRNNAL